MPTTFTPGDEKQDEALNPGQQDYDRRFNDIARAEEAGTFNDSVNNYDKNADSSQEDANIKKLQNQEASSVPNAGWTNNVGAPDDKKKGRAKGWFKKAGPALGIGGIFGVGGFALIALTSPALLIVQVKETMVNKFNTQLSSMESRSNKLLASKMNGATKGFCGSIVTIKCKFSTMSEKQVAKLKAAGIEVESDGKTLLGRTKPASFKFGDKTISAAEFSNMARTNPEFRAALKQAYNPKYAGFAGKAWAAVASKFKITKKTPELDADKDSAKAKAKINDIAKEGTKDPGVRTRAEASDAECKGSSCVSADEAGKINENSSLVESATKDGSIASKIRAGLSGGVADTAGSFFKISAPLDYACQGYGALTMLSYAAKAIRAAQLVRYSMIFFSVADTIKAGNSPKPEDVSLLGSILTTTVKDSSDPTKTTIGSATDSFGYKYAAYGDSSAPEKDMKIANRFIAGGGFVGEMSNVTNAILTPLGGRGPAKATCGTLANPLVQGASIILGIASLFVPGANVAKIAASAAAGVAVSLAIAILPGMLADIVAGTVTKDIAGEESGNAIASGAGSLMSDSLAAQNGNAPMSKADAVAYNSLQTDTTNQYIADDLRTTSPFDATNPNTFLGSIAAKFLPLRSSSTPLVTLGSILTNSVKNTIPTSSALSTEDYKNSLNVCQDMDVQEAGYAADPFCNVIRGIPPQYLDKDPNQVVDELITAGDLTEDGTRVGKYQEFVNKCITNEEPLGYADASTGYNNDEAKSCIINDSNANYYLNYMDQRIELGMSGEDTEEGSGPSSVASVNIDEANLFNDSTSIACAAGTTDAGTNTGYNSGKPIPVRLCSMPNTVYDGKPGLVNSRASGAAYAMFEQMKTDLGLSVVTLNDSFRTMAEQQQAKAEYGDQAADPGYSNHQMGYAFDVNMGSANGGNSSSYSAGVNTSYPGNKVWEWLKANASKYHFSQYSREGWHWSINGG